MLSLEKKFIFIHVPKTAGNAIQNILKKYSDDLITSKFKHQDGIERFDVINRAYNLSKHATISDYRKVLEKDLFNRLYKFSVIRNPWDRMISLYFSPHSGRKIWDRENFVRMVNRTKPLNYYICEENWFKTTILKYFQRDHYYNNIDKNMDFVIRFERLELDFEFVCNMIDIKASSLEIRNASSRAHYSYYYDEELIEIVGEKFSNEIKFGNYEYNEE